MNIEIASYAELKATRDQIETRLREVERQTFEVLERKARDFGFALHQNGAPPAPRAKKPKLTTVSLLKCDEFLRCALPISAYSFAAQKMQSRSPVVRMCGLQQDRRTG